jgi:hypothetical protein
LGSDETTESSSLRLKDLVLFGSGKGEAMAYAMPRPLRLRPSPSDEDESSKRERGKEGKRVRIDENVSFEKYRKICTIEKKEIFWINRLLNLPLFRGLARAKPTCSPRGEQINEIFLWAHRLRDRTEIF